MSSPSSVTLLRMYLNGKYLGYVDDRFSLLFFFYSKDYYAFLDEDEDNKRRK